MSTLRELDVVTADGRTLHAYDTGEPGDDRLAVYWHHGSPNIGAPPAPLFALADELGLRWVSHTRPGYPGSTSVPGRNVASVAVDVAAVADHLGVERLTTIGHSGGGAHALATAALLGDRVLAVASLCGMAPITAHDLDEHTTTGGFDWFAGLGPGGEAELRAAAQGREALEAHLTSAEDEPDFTAGDVEALHGDWRWFIEVVNPAMAEGMGGFIDDDLAGTSPWGFDPASITCPTLLIAGGEDRVVPAAHSAWLAGQIPDAELRLEPPASHISIMATAGTDALRWLAHQR